jgi:hypothetical protein
MAYKMAQDDYDRSKQRGESLSLIICVMPNVAFAEDTTSGNVAVLQVSGDELITPTTVSNALMKI